MEPALQFLAAPFAGASAVEVAVRAADILIVAYLIYRVLLMIRGTRTIAIAVGFLAIYLVYMLSPRLGLDILSYLLDTFFSKLSIFVVFALIIFQEDIRWALGRMGSFTRTAPFIQAKAIEEVVQAAGLLSSRRIGAIILFEGKADLDGFTNEGFVVDGALTRESLFSIFIPSFENPLHDGAVVIRSYRIHKAATIIRHLTTRGDLPKELGTRHRAAIGITEETDAVAIVVSEERGSISVCFKGNLLPSLSMSNLRTILDARFTRESSQEKGLSWLLGKLRRRRGAAAAAETREREQAAPRPAPPARPADETVPLNDPDALVEFFGGEEK